jgi:hypothetical protein
LSQRFVPLSHGQQICACNDVDGSGFALSYNDGSQISLPMHRKLLISILRMAVMK